MNKLLYLLIFAILLCQSVFPLSLESRKILKKIRIKLEEPLNEEYSIPEFSFYEPEETPKIQYKETNNIKHSVKVNPESIKSNNKLISLVKHFPRKDTTGKGPLPYNYRIIDNIIHAGGHLFSPTYTNSDEEAQRIIRELKNRGVHCIITLDSNPVAQKKLKKLLSNESDISQVYIPLHREKLPKEEEIQKIFNEMEKGPVYIHCTWGADRTGMIIANYLIRKKGFTPEEAWHAIITKGSHAGPYGGFKQKPSYVNLLKQFWPNAFEDKPELKKIYQ